MDRSIPLFVLGLIFGGGLGFAIAAGNGVSFDSHDHADPAQHDSSVMGQGAMDHTAMHDDQIDLSALSAPQVSIKVMPDPMTGYNVHVMTKNFVFAPEQASLANVTGTGHAHLYINGKKHSRLYGPWVHIDGLPKGNAEVKVALNTNDHRPLAVDGVPIAASATITVE
tara:strand:- start:1223 stop:1726 length:504 start_codon:yes stop_codon:yes gene_type:complete